MKASSIKHRLFTITSYSMKVLVFMGIWVPLISHYYVPNVPIPDAIIDAARRQPDDAVLDEIKASSVYNFLEFS